MQRQLQALLAWFEPHDALSALLGFRIAEAGEDLSEFKELFEEKRSAMQARAPFVEVAYPMEELPAALVPAGRELLNSVLAAEDEAERHRFRVAMVDLRAVLSFQKAVTLDRPHARVAAVQPDDLQALFDICLPRERVEEDLSGTYDKNGKGLTLTSPNPNLRLGSVQTIEYPPGSGSRLVGMPVIFGAPFVHVVAYKGRFFLKDGYHRTYGLLARGIHRVPVILQTARTFADVHHGGSTLIATEHLLSDRPPTLSDFHDPSVTAVVEQRAFRKVVRICAEEFVINI